jgi:iron(III) transport system ATP-binding protein
MELADTIVVLSEGRVLQQGAPEQLYWQPQSLVAARLLGEVNEVPGKRDGSSFKTAFGAVKIANSLKENPQFALIRPSSVSVAHGLEAEHQVIDSEFSGGHRTLVLQAKNGEILRVSGPIDASIVKGSRVHITFKPEQVGWG